MIGTRHVTQTQITQVMMSVSGYMFTMCLTGQIDMRYTYDLSCSRSKGDMFHMSYCYKPSFCIPSLGPYLS